MAEKSKHSDLWNYFTEGEGKNAICNICKRAISYKTTISNLKSHLKRVHPIQFTATLHNKELNSNEHNVGLTDSEGRPTVGQQPSTSNAVALIEGTNNKALPPMKDHELSVVGPALKSTPKITAQKNLLSFIPRKLRSDEKTKVDKALMGLFTKDLQPFSIVEDKGFKEFVSQLNPSYSLPSRKVVSNVMLQTTFQKCLDITKNYVKSEAKFVCITTDCWSSRNAESYIAVTCHFITNDFKLESVLLDCTLITGSHTGENLSIEIRKILQEWELIDKVTMGVSDNASNISNAFQKYLNLDHIGCYAHSLNLIVQSGLEVFEATINKIKRIVLHFKKSTKSSEKLTQYQLKNNYTQPKKLIQSVPTRWNSVYYMIKRFVELKDCIRATVAVIDIDLPVITTEEWDICSQVSDILEPFEEATRAISGENYLTGSMPIVLSKGLQIVCDQLNTQPLNQVPRLIVERLVHGLDQRFGNLEFNEKLTLCTFLDPRFKHHYFSNETSEIVKNRVKELLIGEMKKSLPCSVPEPTAPIIDIEQQAISSASPLKRRKTFSIWSAVDSVVEQKRPLNDPSLKAEKELDLYIDTDLLDRKSCPFTWWKEHQLYFPNLTKIFKDNCGIVTTSVPCERIFSKTGNILTDRRCSLKSGKLSKIVFLNCNSHFMKRK